MAWLAVLITFGIGIGTVFQGTLNKQMSKSMGLSSAMLFNNWVVLFLGLALWIAVKATPQRFSEIFQPRENLAGFQLWHVLPGICGMAVVIGVPWAIAQIGALKVFLVLVASQMVTSALWDFFIEGAGLNAYRVLGIVLALAGALLTYFKG